MSSVLSPPAARGTMWWMSMSGLWQPVMQQRKSARSRIFFFSVSVNRGMSWHLRRLAVVCRITHKILKHRE